MLFSLRSNYILMDAGGCSISGKIPVELQVFSTSIEFLDLSNNMFVGEIPVDLFQNFDNLRKCAFEIFFQVTKGIERYLGLN